MSDTTIKNFIQKIRSFLLNKKTKKTINKSTNKRKKTLENLGDDADYDGMGDWGRFPPIQKNSK